MQRRRRPRYLHIAGAPLLVLLTTALVTLPSVTAFARAVPGTIVGTWTVQSVQVLPPAVADQGVATLSAGGHTRVITRGHGMVPEPLRAQGWVHVGDPDSRRGVVIDAYQATPGARAKLFAITHADGTTSYYRHRLTAGETYHNSFAAFTPDASMFVAGQWGTTTALQVFRTPPAMPAGSPARPRDLPLAGSVLLAYPVRNIQGCVFAKATTLLCTTDDTGTDLYPVPLQLISMHLSSPLTPTHPMVTAAVQLLGPIPQDPTCSMPGEPEGIDFAGQTLRIMVNSPCRHASLMTTYVGVTHIDDDD